jgi:hypothetical protein
MASTPNKPGGRTTLPGRVLDKVKAGDGAGGTGANHRGTNASGGPVYDSGTSEEAWRQSLYDRPSNRWAAHSRHRGTGNGTRTSHG